MNRTSRVALALAGVWVLLSGHGAAARDGDLERGRYLARIMDCGGCHTIGALAGQPDPAGYLAGSEVGFEIPGLGIFYPPNLTSGAETGLGSWTEEQIITAVRTGVRPDGRQLVPVMPYYAYEVLADEDARALAGFIKSLPPVRHQVSGPVGPGEAAPAPYLSMKMPGAG